MRGGSGGEIHSRYDQADAIETNGAVRNRNRIRAWCQIGCDSVVFDVPKRSHVVRSIIQARRRVAGEYMALVLENYGFIQHHVPVIPRLKILAIRNVELQCYRP